MNTPENQAALRALKGRLCIFKEKNFIRLVRVADVILDDWGARFTFDVVQVPGFAGDDLATFAAGGAWDVLTVSDRRVSAIWVSWILLVRSDLVERVRSFAPQAHDNCQLMNRINELAFGTEIE